MKQLLKRRLYRAAAPAFAVLALILALLLVAGGLPTRAFAAGDGLLLGDYTVTRGDKPAAKIEKDNRVTVVFAVNVPGHTTESAGKLTASVLSDSFRIPKDGVSHKVTSGAGEELALQITVRDAVYKGTGDSLRLKLAYGAGGSDTATLHLYECIPYEKPVDDNDDDKDDKDKKDTHYGAPPLLIGMEPRKTPLVPGEEFTLQVRVQNLGSRLAAANLIISFEPSDGLMLLDESPTRYLQSLRPKQEETVTLRMRAQKEIANPAQSLGVSVKYDYVENETRTSTNTTEKLPVNFDPALTGDAGVATPNVIVRRYDYGEQVAVGELFELTLEIANTSPDVAVENLVMTLETGDGLAVTDASNTSFYPQMAAGGTITRTLQVQALPPQQNDRPDYRLDVAFKYEYVVNGKRTPVTGGEKIAIPVHQPDRFQVTPPSLGEEIFAGEEATISLPYVNKGRSAVSNVEAELIGEISSLETRQNLGNFEAGKSGTIDFVVTPSAAGELPLTIKVIYEDASMQRKTLEFPVKLQVSEQMDMSMDATMGMQLATPPPSGLPGWAIWAGVGGLLAVAAAVVLLRRARQKKRLAAPSLVTVWEDETESAVVEDDPT